MEADFSHIISIENNLFLSTFLNGMGQEKKLKKKGKQNKAFL